MGKIALRDHSGFTLIELLAVMAIVAVLAGIVSVTVSGSSESSRDTQTKQDATSMQSAAAEFFSAQVAAETLRSKTVTVIGLANIEQITGSRWPEDYISNAYAAVFPEDDSTTVASIIFLDIDGTLSDLRLRGLLRRFNAIDFNALVDGEFLETPPDNANRTSGEFNDYLWLFEKATVAGGSSEGASRKVAVFKLVSVDISETSNLVDLTYRRLVGEDFSDELLVNALPPPQTSPLISGDGSILDLDPFNEVSVDGGATWQSAYIVAKHPFWAIISGTQYIFCGPTNIDPCGVGISTLYRTTFTLPSGFSNPSIAVDVHADNAVIVYLNGEEIGQQPCHSTPSCPGGKFSGFPETFSTSLSSLFQVGLNVLSFDLWVAGGAAGFDYKATVTHD